MVKWPCAMVFAVAGVIGAAIGAELGKAVDGSRLLMLFGLLMVGVGLMMLRKRQREDDPDVRLSRSTAAALLPRLVPLGLGVGLAAGFFGIGGGLLIVPALIAATAMPFAYAIGTSLAVVTALGLTTATSYALSGHVDWTLTAFLVGGGSGGAALGIMLGRKLAAHKMLFERAFAILVIGVGIYVTAGTA
jgi:LPXTG-motif cell wall-anchored protein